MADSNSRSALILGSVPLDSAASVFEAVGTKLGSLVKRIPDGETGERYHWIGWQNAILNKTKGFEPGDMYEVVPGWKAQRYRVSAGAEKHIEFGPLGYADAAIRSYEDFKRARTQGKIAPGTRFQVSLPTPIATVHELCEPESARLAWLPYEERMCREIDEIAAAIPHNDLAIQWDAAIEFCFILENPEKLKTYPKEALIASIIRASEHVPPDAELGIHLCYGDAGHKHQLEPTDTKIMVDFSNRLAAALKYPLAWVHMPVPRERDDDAYFAPLRDLKLDPKTEFYLGLIHNTDGLAGALRRLAAAKKVVSNFGVATECGMGRRPPETIPGLLDLHREVAHAE
jgi:hypothetical protein